MNARAKFSLLRLINSNPDSREVPLAKGPMRARILNVVYVAIITLAMAGWVWLLFECLTVAFS